MVARLELRGQSGYWINDLNANFLVLVQEYLLLFNIKVPVLTPYYPIKIGYENISLEIFLTEVQYSHFEYEMRL